MYIPFCHIFASPSSNPTVAVDQLLC